MATTARGARVPRQNRDYWLAKVGRNRARDETSTAALWVAGWRVEVLWECELKDEAALGERLERLLMDPASPAKAGAHAGSPHPEGNPASQG